MTQLTFFLSNFIETVINGTYMFMGAAVLVPSSPGAIFFVACVSMTMLLLNILSAWHEEFEYQIRLQRTGQAFHVACAVHALELSLAENPIQNAKHKRLELEREHNKHYALYKSSVFESIFVGLRYAVGTHKAIMSGIFFTTLLSSTMLGAVLPEIIVLTCMGFSVVASMALCVYAVYETLQHVKNQEEHIQQQKEEITAHVAARINDNTPSVTSHSMFTHNTKPVPLAERTIMKEIEKARSRFAGSRKPKKLLEFILIMQGKSEQEVSDSSSSPLLLLFSMTCYCLLWGEKTHNKQYGPDSHDFSEPSPPRISG